MPPLCLVILLTRVTWRHPQSYTGYEPTSMRAIRARYNPYVQVSARSAP